MFLRVSIVIFSMAYVMHYSISCCGCGCCDCCSSSTMATTQATPVTTTTEGLDINVSRRRRANEDYNIKLTHLPRVQRDEFLRGEGVIEAVEECNCTCNDEWTTTEMPTTTLSAINPDWLQIEAPMVNRTTNDSSTQL